MVGNTDAHCFDFIPHLIEHLAKVLEPWHIRKLFQHSLCLGSTHVYITEGHKFSKAGFVELHQIRSPLVTNTYASEFYFFASLAVGPCLCKREGMDAAAVTSAVSFRNLRRESLFKFI